MTESKATKPSTVFLVPALWLFAGSLGLVLYFIGVSLYLIGQVADLSNEAARALADYAASCIPSIAFLNGTRLFAIRAREGSFASERLLRWGHRVGLFGMLLLVVLLVVVAIVCVATS